MGDAGPDLNDFGELLPEINDFTELGPDRGDFGELCLDSLFLYEYDFNELSADLCVSISISDALDSASPKGMDLEPFAGERHEPLSRNGELYELRSDRGESRELFPER